MKKILTERQKAEKALKVFERHKDANSEDERFQNLTPDHINDLEKSKVNVNDLLAMGALYLGLTQVINGGVFEHKLELKPNPLLPDDAKLWRDAAYKNSLLVNVDAVRKIANPNSLLDQLGIPHKDGVVTIPVGKRRGNSR